jgi:anion-transporting  ArsA/GET3 family ATPase
MSRAPWDELLMSSRVLVCVGSGGVGKTTLAATLAVRAADLGRQVVVLTVDPARRLATALGLETAHGDLVEVCTTPSGGRLRASVIRSKEIFDQFIRTHSGSSELVSRIMTNRLYHQLSTTLAGSQEFTSLEKLLQSTELGADLVILDTPPTKHAIDFLRAPQRLQSLFSDQVTRWFASESSGGLLSGLINRGTRTVLRSLEVLTGPEFISELSDFFVAVRSVQGQLRDRSQRAEKLLRDSGCRFVLVTAFDESKLDEATEFRALLGQEGFAMGGVVVNRAFPERLPRGETRGPGEASSGDAKLVEFAQQFFAFHAARYDAYDRFARRMGAQIPIWRIPDYNRDIYGIDDLRRVQVVQTQASI